MLVEARTCKSTAPILVGSNSSIGMNLMVFSLMPRMQEFLMLQEEETKKETMSKSIKEIIQRLKNGRLFTPKMQKQSSQRVLTRALDLKLRDHSTLFPRCG